MRPHDRTVVLSLLLAVFLTGAIPALSPSSNQASLVDDIRGLFDKVLLLIGLSSEEQEAAMQNLEVDFNRVAQRAKWQHMKLRGGICGNGVAEQGECTSCPPCDSFPCPMQASCRAGTCLRDCEGNVSSESKNSCGNGVCTTDEARVLCVDPRPGDDLSDPRFGCHAVCRADCESPPQQDKPICGDGIEQEGECSMVCPVCDTYPCPQASCKAPTCLRGPECMRDTSDCDPLVCPDGSQFPRCNENGDPINYFAPPCRKLGTQASCSDSDGGVNLTERGTITAVNAQGQSREFSDACRSTNAAQIVEVWCEGVNPVERLLPCDSGMVCREGACVNRIPPPNPNI